MCLIVKNIRKIRKNSKQTLDCRTIRSREAFPSDRKGSQWSIVILFLSLCSISLKCLVIWNFCFLRIWQKMIHLQWKSFVFFYLCKCFICCFFFFSISLLIVTIKTNESEKKFHCVKFCWNLRSVRIKSYTFSRTELYACSSNVSSISFLAVALARTNEVTNQTIFAYLRANSIAVWSASNEFFIYFAILDRNIHLTWEPE